jgi:hypothetical protein
MSGRLIVAPMMGATIIPFPSRRAGLGQRPYAAEEDGFSAETIDIGEPYNLDGIIGPDNSLVAALLMRLEEAKNRDG